MNYIEAIASSLSLPELLRTKRGKKIKTSSDFEKRREEIKTLLSEHVYGELPSPPDSVRVEPVSTGSYAAGKASLSHFKLIVSIEGVEFSFPFAATVPTAASKENKCPAFVFINFRTDTPDRYLPLEEIIDNGFAVFSFCYEDVTRDNDDFKDPLCKLLGINRRRNNASGKIAVWAWSMMRVMDYVQALDYIDLNNIAAVGHSRLGKTALLAGAFDERFNYVISNDSGCGGAAITRGKIGENIARITGVKACWFCPRYASYAGNEAAMPTDQHFLLALTAPRHLLIGSAKEDLWADPDAEFLGAYLASEAHKIYGIDGLIHDGKIPEAGTVLSEGNICYHIREGKHYFSRYDWNVYMNFIKSKMNSRAKK